MENVETDKRTLRIIDFLKEMFVNLLAVIGVVMFAFLMTSIFLILYWYGHYGPTYDLTFTDFIRVVLGWI